MNASYGHPPLFVPSLFLKVLAGTLGVVLAGFALIYLLTGPISEVDIAGTSICTPIVAYLVHLWLAPLSDV